MCSEQLDAVLRVSGVSASDPVCKENLSVNRVTAIGVALGSRSRGEEDGFNYLLGSAESVAELLAVLSSELVNMAPFLAWLRETGKRAEVDVCVFVGSSEPVSVRLSCALMEQCVGLGLGLVISAYPSDE